MKWRPVARQARLVWALVPTAVATVLLGPAAAVAAIEVGWAGALAVLALLGTIVALSWRLATRRWHSWGYALRDADLVLRRGVLFRKLTVVPFGRMQFIDIAQGPLDRLWNLAGVQLHTAAAATDARIPLLPLDEARRLREELTALGEAHASGL